MLGINGAVNIRLKWPPRKGVKFPVMRHGCEAVAWQWWSWNHVPVTRRAPFSLKSAIPPPRRRVDFDGLIMAQVFRILKVIPWRFHLVRGKFPAPGLQQQFCWFTNARCYANRFIPGINKIRGISEDTRRIHIYQPVEWDRIGDFFHDWFNDLPTSENPDPRQNHTELSEQEGSSLKPPRGHFVHRKGRCGEQVFTESVPLFFNHPILCWFAVWNICW